MEGAQEALRPAAELVVAAGGDLRQFPVVRQPLGAAASDLGVSGLPMFAPCCKPSHRYSHYSTIVILLSRARETGGPSSSTHRQIFSEFDYFPERPGPRR